MLYDGRIIDRTPAELAGLEAGLEERLGHSLFLWCGRGATALYFAWLAARRKSAKPGGEALIPAVACPSIASTAMMAGLTPRFADCDSGTGLMDLNSVRERMTDETRAVVFVHLYGRTADLSALRSLCDERGIVLIEDIVQALGAKLPGGAPAGSAGHMAVMSFSRTKILECGGGCLTAAAEAAGGLEEAVREFEAPPALSGEEARILAVSSRNLHHGLVGLMRLGKARDVAGEFLKWRPFFDRLYIEGLREPDRLPAAWAGLEALLERRREKAACYETMFAGGPWKETGGWRESGVVWRYSLLSDKPGGLVSLSDAVRADGFHVSNLYWPLPHFFRPDDVCPGADDFGRRVLNLWVDDSVTLEDVRGCARSLLKHASRTGR